MIKKPPFLEAIKRIYFVGIKGVGMTALACCAQDLGIKVSGSDVKEVFVTDEILAKRKIKWQFGFKEEYLKPKPDLVITTGAHGGLDNPLVKVAKKKGIRVLTHAQALGKFMEGKEGISVCGVGGKTTTSSIIATVFDSAQRKPSFAIGVASLDPLGFPGRYAEGGQFITEADEYANSPGIDNRPRFFFQKPKVIVVTNIEYDHPDIYQNLDHTKETFKQFFQSLPRDGLLVACFDNENVVKTIQNLKVNCQTYGFSPQADWQVEKVFFGHGQTIFNLSYQGAIIENVKIKVPGRFNVLNAMAAFVVGTFFGLDAKTIKKGLAAFKGTKRRFEFIGEAKGIKLYDDYAHHPEEIKATLEAAKKWFPDRRIIAIFQPHTYSRTKALFNDFTRAFSLAKIVVLTDIYASAREKDDLGMSGQLLAEETAKYHPRSVFRAGEKEVIDFLKQEAKENDLIITMGAGDIFQWHQNILNSLKK